MDRYDVGALLTKVPLEDVVRRLGIETEKRGTQTQALCPFHQDTRPSLNIFPPDGGSPAHYHCFACGAHGNAIDLVKHVEGLEFLPAVQWLVQQFGLQSLRRSSSQQPEREATKEAALDFALRMFDEHHDVLRFGAWCEERAFNPAFLHGQGLRCITRAVLVEGLQAKSIGERAELIDGLLALGLELLTKGWQRSDADDAAGQAEQGHMSLSAALEADAQLAERGQPGMCALHHPAMTAKSVIALDAPTGDAALNASLPEMLAAACKVGIRPANSP